MPSTRPPVMLVILDGWGESPVREDNAVRLAHTPNFDRLWAANPHAFLRTSGLDVGLPDGQMGNSEVGHLNIGAGRVVMQDLPRIGAAIAAHTLVSQPAMQALIAALRQSGGTCHLMGLVSPGGVHAHQDHAAALAAILAEAQVPTVAHVFLDGRDTPPRSGGDCLRRFQVAVGDRVRIGTVSGRYYAMDRDKRWDRVARAYLAIAEAEGPGFADAGSVVDDAYPRDVTDEFVVPAVIGGYRGMADGDAILCFNFRADRARELLEAFVLPGFAGFDRPRLLRLASCVGMTRYSDELAPHMTALFAPQTMDNLLGQTVARAGLAQLRLAETEKYPHVTYFLNGGIEAPNPREDRIMVPSPKVATYDLQPEMSAAELAHEAVQAIEAGRHDLLILNFANADMVGHTGVLEAAIKAVEAADAGLGRIAAAMDARHGALLVTADHGNAELMRDPATGAPHTAHTTNKVPVLLTRSPGALHDGRLADIAPTLLALLGIAQPPEMTGRALFTSGE